MGATGMVGGDALRYALDHPSVGVVTAIGRGKLGISHPKLKKVLHQGFADCPAVAGALKDQNAAVFCLSVYTGPMPDAEFRKISIDYTVEFAGVLRANSPAAAFSFLSGMGAGQRPKSHCSRWDSPAFAFSGPPISILKPRKEPNWSYRLLRAIYPVSRLLFPSKSSRPTIWPAMVAIAAGEAEGGNRILENRDIQGVVEDAKRQVETP